MTRVFGELGFGETGYGEMGHNRLAKTSACIVLCCHCANNAAATALRVG